MYAEADFLPISALQHLLFCERQAALIHVDRLWVENRLTVEGRHLHDRAHGVSAGPRSGGMVDSKPGVRIARAVPLHSLRLGLSGVADVVEFHSADDVGKSRDPPLPMPVEYKRGRSKRIDCDRVQLCAQGICLEEMLEVEVPAGALFYGKTRRREVVPFDERLRLRTLEASMRMHEIVRAGVVPRARREPKCKQCSLLELCMPAATAPSRSALRYVERAFAVSNLADDVSAVSSSAPPAKEDDT